MEGDDHLSAVEVTQNVGIDASSICEQYNLLRAHVDVKKTSILYLWLHENMILDHLSAVEVTLAQTTKIFLQRKFPDLRYNFSFVHLLRAHVDVKKHQFYTCGCMKT